MTSSNPPDPRLDHIRGQALVQAMELAKITISDMDAGPVIKAAKEFEAFLKGESNDQQS